MNKLLKILFVFTLISSGLSAQRNYDIFTDTITISAFDGSSEFKLENATKGVIGGVLVNIGDGLTEFQLIGVGGIDSLYDENSSSWITDTIPAFIEIDGDVTNELDSIYDSNSSQWLSNGDTIPTIASSSSLNIWDTIGSTISNTGADSDETTFDFTIGSSQLDDDGDANHDSRFYFDKSKGTLFAGQVSTTYVDAANTGVQSLYFGFNPRPEGSLRSLLGGDTPRGGGASTVVVLGKDNTITNATADYSGILSGELNILDPSLAVIVGGRSNHIDGTSTYSFMGAGLSNYINNSIAGVVVGGDDNELNDGDYSTIGGGELNTISGDWTTIGGGYDNDAQGDYATIGGGRVNIASANYTTIGGGYQNEATDIYCVVVGGLDNEATQDYGFIGGGEDNRVNIGTHAVVVGGDGNQAVARQAFVGGGISNISGGDRTVVVGGSTNTANGSFSSVLGGILNYSRSYGEVTLGVFSLDITANSALTFDSTDLIMHVGNGQSGAPSDALQIYKDGTHRTFAQVQESRIDTTSTGGGNYTIKKWQYRIYVVDPQPASVDTVFLPDLSSAAGDNGRFYPIKDWNGNASTNPFIVAGEGGELIDGSPTFAFNNDYEEKGFRFFADRWAVE